VFKKIASSLSSDIATWKITTLSVLLLTFLSLFLVACTGSTSSPVPTPAGTPPPQTPAAFQVTELVVNPVEVNPGEKVTVTAKVTNTGGTDGTCKVELKIDDITEQTVQIAVDAGTNQTLNFSMSKDVPGSYKVAVGELTEQLIVKSVTPTQPSNPETTAPESNVPSCCRK